MKLMLGDLAAMLGRQEMAAVWYQQRTRDRILFLDRMLPDGALPLGTRESYFCAPYHSWEKGTVENTIGLVRRYLPKRTNLARVTKKDMHFVENRLNNRPRKCLEFQTPAEVFNQLCGALPPRI